MGRASFADARTWQIFSLGILLTYGVSMLAFDQTPANIPLVTGFCLCLLLTASSPAILAVSAVLAIASKFVLRFDGKHIFNPANFAIAVMSPADMGWTSPAQWGSRTSAAFLFVCLACLVLSHAKRADLAIFLIITDPKTTPDQRNARILFAVLVAAVAPWPQFARFMPQALMYALFLASPLVPLLDGLTRRDRPEVRFEWSRPVLN
jgi:enediyne biosynthesis protein E5